jgi:hypothetical protein
MKSRRTATVFHFGILSVYQLISVQGDSVPLTPALWNPDLNSPNPARGFDENGIKKQNSS